MRYELLKVTTEEDWRDYHTIRRDVLWDANGKSGYDDTRPAERLTTNHPLILKLDSCSIATTRLDDLGDGRGVVRLVAVAANCQRRGHGRILSGLVEDYARRLGLTNLFVNADPDAVDYYEKMGWSPFIWDAAELAGIAADCKQMTKTIKV